MIVAAIPAYNEEKTIEEVILRAQKHVDKVIVCDDGSTDRTADVAQKLDALVIRHRKNLGYGAALQSLFAKARVLEADVVLTLDADGQHNPEEIPKLVTPVQKDDVDLVIGSRFLGETNSDVPRYRRLGIKLITKLSNGRLECRISDAQSGFRAYSKKAIHALKLREKGMGISAEILMKAGEHRLKVTEVPVGVSYKGIETSTHNPLRHGWNVIVAIVRLILFEKPLEFLGIPGTILFLVGVVMGLVFYYNYYLIQPPVFIPIVFFLSLALLLAGTLAIFTASIVRARKPLLYLGMPGGVSFFLGFSFGTWALQIYLTEQRIETNIAMVSLAFIFIGMFTVSTAINVIREQRRLENKKH